MSLRPGALQPPVSLGLGPPGAASLTRSSQDDGGTGARSPPGAGVQARSEGVWEGVWLLPPPAGLLTLQEAL